MFKNVIIAMALTLWVVPAAMAQEPVKLTKQEKAVVADVTKMRNNLVADLKKLDQTLIKLQKSGEDGEGLLNNDPDLPTTLYFTALVADALNVDVVLQGGKGLKADFLTPIEDIIGE